MAILFSNEALSGFKAFGFGWGVGSTLFGLGLSRVGMALSFAIVLGITASLGSLLPLLVLEPQQLFTPQGTALMAGLGLVVLGIVLCAVAGRRRERELSAKAQQVGLGLVAWVMLALARSVSGGPVAAAG